MKTIYESEIMIQSYWPPLTAIAFETINCFKSFNWFNYFAGPHIRHVETFLPIDGTFCNLFLFTARLCSFIGIIFHEIQTPKLKASLTSIDIILATISSCQGIKMYSIHLILLQKGTYFNYWSTFGFKIVDVKKSRRKLILYYSKIQTKMERQDNKIIQHQRTIIQ